MAATMVQALPPLASGNYPLLDAFWTMLWFFLWILWIFLLFRILTDVFRSSDLSGWMKAFWTIFIIILPFLGVLVYLIARGSSMHRREAREDAEAEAAMRSYIRSAAGTSPSVADEIAKLSQLHQQGALTDQEFEAQKAKLLAR